MQARNIFVWGLTPVILLVGVYLEVKDRPEEPLRANPVMTFTPDLDTFPSPAAIPIPPAKPEPAAPEFLSYWDWNEEWDDKRRESRKGRMTKLQFKEWEEEHAGTKIQVTGVVDQIEPMAGYSYERCMLRIDEPRLMGGETFHHIILCDDVKHLNKGDTITFHCVTGDNSIISPDVEECLLQ